MRQITIDLDGVIETLKKWKDTDAEKYFDFFMATIIVSYIDKSVEEPLAPDVSRETETLFMKLKDIKHEFLRFKESADIFERGCFTMIGTIQDRLDKLEGKS